MKNKVLWSISAFLIVLVMVLSACAAPASTTLVTTDPQATITQSPTSTTSASATTPSAMPQGELVAALTGFGNENFLPWVADSQASQLNCLVYDMLIYFDEINRKNIPGLAESWEVSPDALTTTFKLRKGVQFSEGWGELTAEDVKYNFQRHTGLDSTGKLVQTRRIASMDIPDPYTLVCHIKDPYPTFPLEFSLANSGTCQGIVSKKYVETVGDTIASQKPIGTGPYKLVESQVGSYYKFEALDSHWRVVPEFKKLTLRAVPEISTVVAMLKNREVDLASVTGEQMADLKATGLATEVSLAGGVILVIGWGGICIPEDKRYDPAVHNKDPWIDLRVRQALSIAIDREAICKAIFAGGAIPVGVPLFSVDMDKYQYPYDPVAARQLLADAGYSNGFSFTVVSYAMPGVPEMPRVMEALVGYWQQIGLDPKITVSEFTAYSKIRQNMKTAGAVNPYKVSNVADMMERMTLTMLPQGMQPIFMDEGSLSIWQEGRLKVSNDERDSYVKKLNQYYYENYGPIPLVRYTYNFAWDPVKLSPFPHPSSNNPYYFEYIRHAQPLNTYSLFRPWPDR